MNEIHAKFIKDSESKAFDVEHRNKLNFNISKYDEAVVRGKKQYSDLEAAKIRATKIKRNALNGLDILLAEFETNFQLNGGKIIWAEDSQEAIKEILSIVEKHNIKKVVKSKSMVTEEIELNKHLAAYGVEAMETDLGEFIVQLDGDKPYHIVTPAMHKSKEEVAKLFNQKFNLDPKSTPEQITSFVRKHLRSKFLNADAGISGVNFLISDIGAIAITENEGNGVLSTSMPKVHIAIAGIERMIPSYKDMDLFWSLLSTYGTGQKISSYNTIISGPKKDDEVDGPTDVYLVLLDNGRTKVLETNPQKEALACIRCGACLNVCPIYKNIGGHAYGTVYSGPIGSIISPIMKGMEDYNHLAFACTLCGLCTEECPVSIPLHKLLLYTRRDAVKAGHVDKSFARTMKYYKMAMKNRKLVEMIPLSLKNTILKFALKGNLSDYRDMPTAVESFNSQWKKRFGKG